MKNSNNTKIALITGASRGLGREMAIRIAERGADIVFTYNANKEKADELITEINSLGRKALAIQLDVASTANLAAFVTSLKEVLKNDFSTDKLDYLVNNAGVGINKPFAQTTEEDFDGLFNIQFKSVYFLTQQLLETLNDGGAILNVSTGLARFTLPGYSAYASMKGAVETFTKYLAKELGARKIRANVIAPGAIETDFGGGVVRDNKAMNDHIASTTALGRVGLPDDIGGVAAFLLSDDAKWVNGQRIEVSGGVNL